MMRALQCDRLVGRLRFVRERFSSFSGPMASHLKGQSVMPRRIWVWCLAVLLAMVAAPARADFQVLIASPTIAQGGTGALDVYLTSNASSSSPDLLNNYSFTLQITGPNELMFSTAQSFNYLSNSQYVFAGDSTAQSTMSPGGTVTNSGPPNGYANDTFVGFDSTFSGNPVSLSSSNTPLLLAAITLDAGITAVGDSYAISLMPSTGNGSMNSSSQTFFDVFDFNTGGETSAVPFTSTPGEVTISGAAVPRAGIDHLRADRDAGRRGHLRREADSSSDVTGCWLSKRRSRGFRSWAWMWRSTLMACSRSRSVALRLAFSMFLECDCLDFDFFKLVRRNPAADFLDLVWIDGDQPGAQDSTTPLQPGPHPSLGLPRESTIIIGQRSGKGGGDRGPNNRRACRDFT